MEGYAKGIEGGETSWGRVRETDMYWSSGGRQDVSGMSWRCVYLHGSRYAFDYIAGAFVPCLISGTSF